MAAIDPPAPPAAAATSDMRWMVEHYVVICMSYSNVVFFWLRPHSLKGEASLALRLINHACPRQPVIMPISGWRE